MKLPNSPLRSLCRVLASPLWIAALVASVVSGFGQSNTNNHALVGPFVSGAKGWTPVPGGDFETGSTNLPVNFTYGPLIGDIELFVSAGASGSAQRSAPAAFSGSAGIDVKPGPFTGAGIAVTYYKTISVQPGQSVVLSAFVKRLHPAASKAEIALDFWGAPGSVSIPVPATTSEWQFVYGVYTALAGAPINIGARLNIDGVVTPDDEVYIDELSVTPLSQFVPPRQGGVLVGPFVPGSGSWTNLPGGNFEDGPYALPMNTQYGPLIGDMELFLSAGSVGSAFRSNSAAYSGAHGVDLRVGTFQGAGVGVTYYKLYPVPAGSSVVLSAFVRRVNPATSRASVFLDFWAVSGTERVLARPNVAGWQFLYSVFTAPLGGGFVNLGARVGVDGDVTPDDHILIDELAMTPLEQFVPPQPLLGDFTLGAQGTAVLDNGFVVKIQLASGGFGYTNVPHVSIAGGGGTGATAVATVLDGIVTGVKVTSAGIGYSNAPVVLIEPPRPVPPSGATGSVVVNGGFVTAVTLKEFGSGYTRAPAVQIVGGGGSGATATALMANGVVVGVVITGAGSGYTSAPMVIIDPPVLVAVPPYSVSLEVKIVTVTLSVASGRVYLLESSPDLNVWTAIEDPFLASSPRVKKDFEVGGSPTYFRLRDITYAQ